VGVILKRKKVLFTVSGMIIVFLILGIVVQMYVPKPVISETKNISIWKIVYYGTEISVNEDKQDFYTIPYGDHNWSGTSVDENKLIDILSKYNSKKAFQNYFPYESDKIDIEIYIVENHKPKHILLGEFAIWYESGDKGAYNILNGQKLIDELKSIIEKNS
jgi:hypothetical protein